MVGRRDRASIGKHWRPSLLVLGFAASCSSGSGEPTGTTCPAGYTECGDQCLDLTSNAQSCGACGTVCTPGQTCTGGACQCQPRLFDCNGQCINLQGDGANCGTCGTTCAAGQVCAEGVCSAEGCPAGQLQCGTSCVVSATDPLNCGSCGMACAAPMACTGGTCVCPTGTTSCAGRCVDTLSDLNNCGACGTPCTRGATCASGACVGGTGGTGTGGVGMGGAAGTGGAETGGVGTGGQATGGTPAIVGATPPMGWNSWNAFGCNGLNESVVRGMADAFVTTGMRDVGYEYVNLDDCWMDGRDARIDRTLQPAKVVRCHYFVYPRRAEDAVLDKLVDKVETIQRQLGSLGEVVMVRIEKTLERGIDSATLSDIDDAERLPEQAETTRQELESQRADVKALRRDIDEARRILNRSRAVMDYREELLRDAIDVGLELAGADRLKPVGDVVEGQAAYELPLLPPSWDRTLDTLRRPRRRDEQEWQWRKEPPQPVVFKALDRIGESRVHLHLGHPFVQRILSRFLSQGFGAQDLSRVTIVPDNKTGDPRAIAFGRLSLFGPGAARLHDELIVVSAPWRETGTDDHLVPSGDAADDVLIERLEQSLVNAIELPPVPDALERRLAKSAGADFSKLWPHVRDEADEHAHRAAQLLTGRGEKEAEDLRKILIAQRANIQKQLNRQLELFPAFEPDAMKLQREQLESERQDMQKRLARIEEEMRVEPEQLRELYTVSLKRLVPVGLVYLWPTTSL